MEKYRSSADPSTGIHPFIPPTPRRTALDTLLKPLLLAFRLPLLLGIVLVYLPFSLLATLLSPIPPLSYAVRRVRDILLLAPALACLGALAPPAPRLDRPRVRTPAAAAAAPPRRRDVIFCNHASLLDLVYLARHYSPVFATPSATGGVVRLSLWTALRRVHCAPVPVDTHSAVPLSEACGRGAPLVVLAEACATNGRGVLRFVVDTASSALPAHTRVFALGLAYSPDRREACVLGSPLGHLVRLAGAPRACVRARVAAVAADSPPPQLQAAVAGLAGVPPLTVGHEAGAKFRAHWEETGGKTQ